MIALRRDPAGPHTAEIVLDRPEALNALSLAMAERLAAVCGELAADGELRAVVLSSSCERAFCVGADLKERGRSSDDDLRRGRPVVRSAYGGVLHLPVPTVAAVHGYALGGGTELALSCDVVVADATAVLGLPEVTLGMVPGGGGTQLAVRRVGWSRAVDLVGTGRRVPAAEAGRLGLVDRVVAAGHDRDEALRLAATIAAYPAAALRDAKAALRSVPGR